MSVKRTFQPEVRLKRLLARPGGISVERALAQAERGLETLRHSCCAAIDEMIEEIARLSLPQPAPNAVAIYHLADEVFAMAGTFGLSDLSRAAYSLCSLMTSEHGAKSVIAVQLHIDAMRVLRAGDAKRSPTETAKMLDGLGAVTRRFT